MQKKIFTSFRTTEEQKEALRYRAKKEGLDVSNYILKKLGFHYKAPKNAEE